MVVLVPLDVGLRRLLYLLSPNETSFATIDEVPSYTNEAIPYFILLIILEFTVKTLRKAIKGQKVNQIGLNDAVTSVSAGLSSLLVKLLIRGADIVIYSWVYDNYCIYDLPWDHPLTWWLGFVGIDFCYYWLHRCGHEINYMWAAHQAHHSSEYYNLTTALRQSSLHVYISWIFYLPLALFIRPSVTYTHLQFSLLYQFWIHTEEIKSIGPLEMILNTPSHHRVHHGRNRYAIDKNYGGTLIVWDRLFGTFAAERDTEELAYGLVHPINTFDGTEVQLVWYKYMFKQLVPKMSSLKDKLKAVFYGPGWTPEKTHLRLGQVDDLPDIKGPVHVYNPTSSWFMTLYGVTQFTFCVVLYQLLTNVRKQVTRNGWAAEREAAVLILGGIVYMLVAFTTVGRCFDNEKENLASELKRVVLSSVLFGVLGTALASQSMSTYAWTLCVFNALSAAAVWRFGSLSKQYSKHSKQS